MTHDQLTSQRALRFTALFLSAVGTIVPFGSYSEISIFSAMPIAVIIPIVIAFSAFGRDSDGFIHKVGLFAGVAGTLFAVFLQVFMIGFDFGPGFFLTFAAGCLLAFNAYRQRVA